MLGQIDLVHDTLHVDAIFETMWSVEVDPAFPASLRRIDVVAPTERYSSRLNPLRYQCGPETIVGTTSLLEKLHRPSTSSKLCSTVSVPAGSTVSYPYDAQAKRTPAASAASASTVPSPTIQV